MNRILKGLLSFLLSAVMAASLFVSAFCVSAAAPVISLTANVATASCGDEVQISVSSTNAVNAVAFSTEIIFSADSFTVLKATVSQQELSDTQIGVKNGKLILNWMSNTSDNVSLPEGKWFTVHLSVSDNAQYGDKTFSLNNTELFDKNLNKITVQKGGDASVTVGAPQKSETVLNAENAIAAIGTVDTSDTCLMKITAAQIAFNKCSASEKKQVENYSVLEEAIRLYNTLREQQNAQENAEAVQREIDEFKAKDILKLTTETVEAVNLEEINKTLSEYAGKTLYIRNQLKEEYNLLLALKEVALNKNDAPGMVEGFLQVNSGLLALNPETFAYDEATFRSTKAAIESAIASYNDYNSLAQSMLNSEYEHLLKLLDRCYELETENSPEPAYVTEAYNAFRKKYLNVLFMTEGEVTDADLATIQSALNEIKKMKPAVSGKLISEYEHLMNLLAALNTAEMNYDTDIGGSAVINTVEVEKIVEKTVEVPVEVETQAGAKKLNVKMSPSSKFGIIVFVLLITAIILFAAPVVTRFILENKMRKEKP